MARGFGQNGDSDADADSDGSDFLAWQRELGQSANVTTSAAAIPEPSTELLLFLAFLSTTFRCDQHQFPVPRVMKFGVR
jgi:hypothetical protein